MLYDNLGVNVEGHLTFCGMDTVKLAEEYGTPLYLIDENGIRDRCRVYTSAMKKAFGAGAMPIYAGKALCFKKMYKIMAEENMGADVSSSGELYTAYKAGFPVSRVFFHGNNKTDEDIKLGIELGVGYFICDNQWELESINAIAGSLGVTQKVILRLTPGIDPHTLEAINTGKVDSKFGVAIETGQGRRFVLNALNMENVELSGYHCHIGSQVFDGSQFIDAAEIMLKFTAEVKAECGYEPEYLDLGGGMGVPYTEDEPTIDYGTEILHVGAVVKSQCEKYGVKLPKIIMEPGRSIVGDKGITLYKVGGRKEIPGFKNYIAIDGGMTDNPRYPLYKAKYTVVLASRANDKADYRCTVAGRCCESGDMIQEDVMLPRPERGEILAVLTTGAYNYSMASNYNRIPRPPVVMIKDGKTELAVKRETLDDIIMNDM